MSWHRGLMLALDTETTGPEPTEARVVTACTALVDGAGDARPAVSSWLVDPGVEIPEASAAIHGVTTDRARAEGVSPVEALDQVATHLTNAWQTGVPVVGHNVSFDLTVLACELDRHGLQPLTVAGPVIDTAVLDKAVDRYRRGKRTLTATCEHYGVRLDGAHDSTFDALAAARIAWKIASLFPQVQVPLDELHAKQIEWAAEQAAGLQDYFRRTDPRAVVDGTWPIRLRAAAVAS